MGCWVQAFHMIEFPDSRRIHRHHIRMRHHWCEFVCHQVCHLWQVRSKPRTFGVSWSLFYLLVRRGIRINPPGKNPPEKIPLSAVEHEPVPTRVLNHNASEASYKPKQRSYRKTKLKQIYFFFRGDFNREGFCRRNFFEKCSRKKNPKEKN